MFHFSRAWGISRAVDWSKYCGEFTLVVYTGLIGNQERDRGQQNQIMKIFRHTEQKKKLRIHFRIPQSKIKRYCKRRMVSISSQIMDQIYSRRTKEKLLLQKWLPIHLCYFKNRLEAISELLSTEEKIWIFDNCTFGKGVKINLNVWNSITIILNHTCPRSVWR